MLSDRGLKSYQEIAADEARRMFFPLMTSSAHSDEWVARIAAALCQARADGIRRGGAIAEEWLSARDVDCYWAGIRLACEEEAARVGRDDIK